MERVRRGKPGRRLTGRVSGHVEVRHLILSEEEAFHPDAGVSPLSIGTSGPPPRDVGGWVGHMRRPDGDGQTHSLVLVDGDSSPQIIC